jgi:hypothetical protein
LVKNDVQKILSLLVYPIDSTPFGLSYGEWSAKWWKWLLSIPASRNPAFDSSGINAWVNQNQPHVFFLCQTFQNDKATNTEISNRSVLVRAGISVLIPIINWISIIAVDGNTDEELMSVASKRMNVVSSLEITLNDITIKEGLLRYRAISPFFDVFLPRDNILRLDEGFRRFVADGYWIFLKSLDRETKLSTFGSCSSGLNRFKISYNLLVTH